MMEAYVGTDKIGFIAHKHDHAESRFRHVGACLAIVTHNRPDQRAVLLELHLSWGPTK